jgi:predicted secreted hydrolase
MMMDDREKACYLAMWNGERGADRNPLNYQRRDDGSHIFHNTADYYEWWYFDAAFNDGSHIVITFHYRNIFLEPMHPSVQLFIYGSDGGKTGRFQIISPEDACANPDYCDVRMGGNWVKDHGGRYELYMKIKGVGAHLTFQNRVPPWKPGTGFNYKDEKTGMTAGWVVPVPYARVAGKLYLEDRVLDVEGGGYHDHNWGNYRFQQTFSGWYWGRIHGELFAIDYAWVLPRQKDAPILAPLLIAREGEIVLSTNRLTVDLLDFQRDENTGQGYAGRLVLRAEASGVCLEMKIETHRVIDSMLLPQAADWNQFYYRFLGHYAMRLETDGVEHRLHGEMLHELMLL